MIGRLFPDGFPPAEAPPSCDRRPALLLAFGLFAALVALYWPAVDFGLLAIDDPYYVRSIQVSRGLEPASIVRAFTSLPEEDLYLPVTTLSFMADVSLFGVSARGFHLTNVLLHAISMALLLLVLWRMTGSLWRSGLAAALVALHPLRVESVAWVAERKDVLAIFFFVATMGAYLRYARTGRLAWYAAVLLGAVVSLLSKPILVTLPLLLLLLDFWPLGRVRQAMAAAGERPPSAALRGLVLEKLPLLALSAGISLLVLKTQGAGASIHVELGLLPRIFHAAASGGLYLFQTLWPADLGFRTFEKSWGISPALLALAAAGTTCLTIGAIRFAGRFPAMAAGWGWYLVALLPVSGVLPSGVQWLSDRFTYLPHIGLMLGLAWTIDEIALRRGRRREVAVLLVAAVGAAALTTSRQLPYWKDGATLFAKRLEASRDDPRYVDHYAGELMALGDFARARSEVERILPHALDPWYGIPIQLKHLDLIERLENRSAAIAQARRYLAAESGFWKTRLRLADLLLADGQYREAAATYRLILREPALAPSNRVYTLEGLGASLSGAGETAAAIECLEAGRRLDPENPILHYHLARAYAAAGRQAEARASYEAVLRLDPGNEGVLRELADSLSGRGGAGTAQGKESAAPDSSGSAGGAPVVR
jgi:tetratricopeptide (TPR) repeat protein